MSTLSMTVAIVGLAITVSMVTLALALNTIAKRLEDISWAIKNQERTTS